MPSRRWSSAGRRRRRWRRRPRTPTSAQSCRELIAAATRALLASQSDITRVAAATTSTLPRPRPRRQRRARARRRRALGRYACSRSSAPAAWASSTRAYDPELDRKVALKLLRAESPTASSARAARAAAARGAGDGALRHPNVVTVYDVGTLGEQRLHRHGARRRRDAARVAARRARARCATIAARLRRRPGAGWRRRTRPASCIATSSPTTCSSARRARARHRLRPGAADRAARGDRGASSPHARSTAS